MPARKVQQYTFQLLSDEADVFNEQLEKMREQTGKQITTKGLVSSMLRLYVRAQSEDVASQPTKAKPAKTGTRKAAKEGEGLTLTWFTCGSCGKPTSARGKAVERFESSLCPSCWIAR